MTQFMAHEFKCSLPIAAVLPRRFVWAVNRRGQENPEFSFGSPRAVRPSIFQAFEKGEPQLQLLQTEDVITVRSEFFAIQTPEDADRFFARFGPFELEPSATDVSQVSESFEWGTGNILEFRRANIVSTEKAKHGSDTLPAGRPIRWKALIERQERFKDALVGDLPPGADEEFELRGPLAVQIQLPKRFHVVSPLKEPRWPIGFVTCADVSAAITASIFLKRLTNSRWRKCLRRDCWKVFEQTDIRKVYCSQACAHLESVRKSRQHGRSKRTSGRKPR